MEIILAGFSDVLFWQLRLGCIQLGATHFLGRLGAVVSFGLVVLWTLTETYGETRVIQLVIQGIIGFYCYSYAKNKENDTS